MQLGFLQFKRTFNVKVLERSYFNNCDIASRYECIYQKIRAEAQSNNLLNIHLLLARDALLF